jgi:hypothetical protein
MTASIKLAGLEATGVEKVSANFKIDKELVDGLKVAEERLAVLVKAKKIKPMTVNRTVILEEAYREFIKALNAQMDKVDPKGAASSGESGE